jgi:superfamily I DNA/RNA helicase
MSSVKFTPDQTKILDSNANNIIVSACAGSGKSSTLVEKANRELRHSKPWKKIVILTFTNKSKNDLVEKIENSSVIISTFHSFIFENIFPFDRKIGDQLKEVFRKQVNDYDTWIENLHSQSTILGSKGKNDFVLEHAIKLCEKKNVKSFLKSKFHAIYIDEAQDNNIQQYSLVECFIKLGIKILMVGDANQTLYGFRGACSNTFNKYLNDSRFVNCELKQNFRCHPIINNIANSYSFPNNHVYKDNMGYFVIKIEQLNVIVERMKNESIVFLKKTNFDLVDYDGKFSILKDISFSPDLDDTVKKIVTCFLKLKFKENYNFYSMLDELLIDLEKFKKVEIDFFRNGIEKYIYENDNLSDDILNLLGFSELKSQICETYNLLSQLEETKNFFQNRDKHVTMTIHSSKGLEFDNVILRAGDLYHNGEFQRTNYYVSMTRAKKRVFVIF